MPVATDKPVFINGAGIGGLTAALSFAKAGYRVVVYEKAEGFETLGAGLQISPNAACVLYSLGLSEKLLAIASQPNSIEIRNGVNDKHLVSIPLGQAITQQYRFPYLVAHRADLQQLLYNACIGHAAIEFKLSSSIIEMAPHDHGVTITADEQAGVFEHRGSAVIVADGIWSELRTKVLQLKPPHYSGKVAWRMLAPAREIKNKELLASTHVWFGPKSHIVSYPVRDGRQLNVVVITDGPKSNEGETLEISSDELGSRLTTIKANIFSTLPKQAKWTGWPLFETRDVSPMHIRNVALIGDAAHAMLPFAAQGAAMAIEDATVLAECFTEFDQPNDAIAHYAKLREPRIKQVMKTARSNGRIYHMSGIRSEFRDFGMWLIPTSRLAKRQDWIYSWRPDQFQL